jgi:5-methylcytosine-specific restriction enzyme subunit McrC
VKEDIILKEHVTQEVTLSGNEVGAIRKLLPGKVDIWPTGETNRYLIRPSSYVGFVVLPSRRTLVIGTKVPIETLFALLAAVYDPTRKYFQEDLQAYTTLQDLFEFVVKIFANHVEDLITRGILKGYRQVTTDTSTVKGRLLLAETIHHRPALHDRHYCSFSHFTPDISENRILNWTSFCLERYTYKEKILLSRLHRISRALLDVDLDPRSRWLFDRIQFHRLNERYQPALALARLLLDHLTFSGAAGKESFLAYLIDMNWLFERYLGVVIKRAAGQWGVQVREQDSHALDLGNKIRVQPDIVLYKNGKPLLVIDAKYKLEADQGDIYQMLAYCHAVGIDRAVLVHPASEDSPQGSVSIRRPGEIRVDYLTLDLSGAIDQIKTHEGHLIDQVQAVFVQNAKGI